MATFVIAGRSDCPEYAQVEALADHMAKNLDSFEVRKMVMPPEKWSDWLGCCCSERGWKHSSSPLVWRELVDRGGKGLYMGGSSEFFDYAKHYYNLSPVAKADLARAVAAENCLTEKVIRTEKLAWRQLQNDPLFVCVSNAGSAQAYHFLERLVSGEVCPSNFSIIISLLVNDRKMSSQEWQVAEGVAMEMMDCAKGALRSVTVTSDPARAFAKCSAVFLLDEPTESSETCLKQYASRMEEYASAIDQCCRSEVFVAVSGSHANLGASVVWQAASEGAMFKTKRQIIAIGQAGLRRAKSLIAQRLGIGSHQVENVVAWGRVDYPCLLATKSACVYRHVGAITGPDSYAKDVHDVLHDHRWINSTLLSEARPAIRSPQIAATALAEIAQIWMSPELATATPDRLYSLGIVSRGEFGLPEGVTFSVPTKVSDQHEWQVVEDYPLTESETSTLHAEAERLQAELKQALEEKPKSPADSPLQQSNL